MRAGGLPSSPLIGQSRDSIPQPLFYFSSKNLTFAGTFIAVDVGIVRLAAVRDAERVLCGVVRGIRRVPQEIQAILADLAHEKGALEAAL